MVGCTAGYAIARYAGSPQFFVGTAVRAFVAYAASVALAIAMLAVATKP